MVNNSALFPAFFSQKERTIFRAPSGSRGPWTSLSANDLKDLLIFFTHWKRQILRIFRGLGFNYIIALGYSWRAALLGICQLSPTCCRFSILNTGLCEIFWFLFSQLSSSVLLLLFHDSLLSLCFFPFLPSSASHTLHPSATLTILKIRKLEVNKLAPKFSYISLELCFVFVWGFFTFISVWIYFFYLLAFVEVKPSRYSSVFLFYASPLQCCFCFFNIHLMFLRKSLMCLFYWTADDHFPTEGRAGEGSSGSSRLHATDPWVAEQFE